MLKFGDILVTYGSFGLWPPRRLLLWIVYNGIYLYQKKKWGEYSDYKPTHVRMYDKDGFFFESTTPNCRFIHTSKLDLDKKKYLIVRCKKIDKLNRTLMREKMNDLEGTPYDIGDLADFFITGVLLGYFKDNISLIGDRTKKYLVCSTALGTILKVGGFPIIPQVTDPAFFVNRPDLFTIIKE